jgi:hypothetical protein
VPITLADLEDAIKAKRWVTPARAARSAFP